MDPDLFFVIGLAVGVLSIPSILGALVDGRVPRVAAISIVVSGSLIAFAVNEKPGGYKVSEIPDVLVEVAGRYLY